MRLANEIVIGRPVGEVFGTLLDVERVAPCMPGSRLLGRVGDDTYEGEVTLEVGPLEVSYLGTVRFVSVDSDARVVTLRASGREQSGQGDADAHVVARVVADGGGTRVVIDTDLMLRGMVARFGLGVIGEITQRLMGQFASNVEEMLAGQPPAAPTPDPAPAAPDGLRLAVGPVLRRLVPVAVAAALVLAMIARRRRA